MLHFWTIISCSRGRSSDWYTVYFALYFALLRLFLILSTCLDTFVLLKLIMVWPLFLIQWQSSRSSTLISTPALVLHKTSLRSLSRTEERIPVILRHSHFKYWVFAKHSLSRKINFSLRELFSILVALKSDFKSSNWYSVSEPLQLGY